MKKRAGHINDLQTVLLTHDTVLCIVLHLHTQQMTEQAFAVILNWWLLLRVPSEAIPLEYGTLQDLGGSPDRQRHSAVVQY